MSSVDSSGAYPAPNAIWEIGLHAPLSSPYTGARLEMNAGSMCRWFYSPTYGPLKHVAFNNQSPFEYDPTGTTLSDLPKNSQFTIEWAGNITINGCTLFAPTRGSLTATLTEGNNSILYNSYEGLVLNTPWAYFDFSNSLTLSGNITSFAYYVDGIPFWQKNSGDINIYGGYSIADYNELDWIPLTNWITTNEPDMEFNYPVGAEYFLLQISNLVPYIETPNVPEGKLLPTITTLRQNQTALGTVTADPYNDTHLPLPHKLTVKSTATPALRKSAMPYYSSTAGYVTPGAVAYGYTELELTEPIVTMHGADVDYNGNVLDLQQFEQKGKIGYGSQINSLQLVNYINAPNYLPDMHLNIYGASYCLGSNAIGPFILPKPARSVEINYSGAWKTTHYLSTDPTTDDGLGFFPTHPDLQFTWNADNATWNSDSAVWGLLQPVAYSHPGYQGGLISRLQNPTSDTMTFVLGSLGDGGSNFAYNYVLTYQSNCDFTLTAGGINYTLSKSGSWNTYTAPDWIGEVYTVSISIPSSGWVDIQTMAINQGQFELWFSFPDNIPSDDVFLCSENNRYNFGKTIQQFTIHSTLRDNTYGTLPPGPMLGLTFYE